MIQKISNLEANDLFITPHLGSDSLPKLIQDCLAVAKTPSTKDMLLLSLLTNCAYALPAMRCYHGVPRHEYGPDLMTMVLAPAAGGSLMQKHFLDNLPSSFSKQDAEHLANTLGVSVKTLNNWLTNWVKNAIIQHVTYGEYSKIA